MAKAGSFAIPETRSTWSPSYLTKQTKIQRRYVQIPSEQRELLNRPDAWSAVGIPNVPARVLEDLRSRHVRNSGSPPHGGREALSSQPATPMQHDPAQPRGEPKGTSVEVGADSVTDEEESGTPIPWSPSPSGHLRGPYQQKGLAAAASVSRQPSPAQQYQQPAAERPASRILYLKEFPPSSSMASETGLEVEVPKAITDVLESVNREAVPAVEPTPPSAQIIPCTITEPTSPVRLPDAKRHRGLMKHPAAVFDSAEAVGKRQPSRLSLPTAARPAATGSPSPTTSSSASVFRAASGHAPVASPATLSVKDGHLPAASNQVHTVTATSQPARNVLSSNATDELPPNGPPSQVPFTTFKLAYPDYKGSLGTFIRGVICIMNLQKERALPEFLYDDFVRVFSSDFLDYVSAVDGKQPALPAVQWYNENVSRPLYMKGILTKSNIKHIPSQYPNQVRAVQENLKKLKSSKTRVHDRPSQQALVTERERKETGQAARITAESTRAAPHGSFRNAAVFGNAKAAVHSTELPSDPVPMAEGSPAMEEPRKAAPQPGSNISVRRSSIGKAGPVCTAKNNGPATESLGSRIDSSLPDIERSQTPQGRRMEIAASGRTMGTRLANTLPSTALSQQSNPESIPETTLKRRSAPRVSAGSPAGEPSTAFKRPRRSTEQPDKRLLQWKKFLLKRSTQGSAPGGSAAA
ncbi:hypothetical protein VTK56DRAFT_1805 [Thermocarpiscus australiensis]